MKLSEYDSAKITFLLFSTKLARSHGARYLEIEATFANDRFLDVLARRYKDKITTVGANETIRIELK